MRVIGASIAAWSMFPLVKSTANLFYQRQKS